MIINEENSRCEESAAFAVAEEISEAMNKSIREQDSDTIGIMRGRTSGELEERKDLQVLTENQTPL